MLKEKRKPATYCPNNHQHEKGFLLSMRSMMARDGRAFFQSVCVALVCAITISSALAAAGAQEANLSSVTVTRAKRQIDLRQFVVRTSTDLTFKNKGSVPVTHLYLTELSKLHQNTGLYSVQETKTGSDDKEAVGLRWEKSSLPLGGDQSEYAFIQVKLAKPLEPEATVRILVKSSRFHVLEALPATIRQGGTQLVVYEDNHYVLSPYYIETQTTEASVYSQRFALVESYTEESPTELKNDQIKYGPYSNVEPLTRSAMKIHYENNDSFVSAKKVTREITVSHWGAISFRDSYELRHNGPQYVGEFSRWDYQRNKEMFRFAVRRFQTRLPSYLSDIYYRDAIGNISTSHVHQGKDHIDFTWGYTIPLGRAVAINTSSGKYRLTIPFNVPFPFPVEHIEVKILLPEGASGIKVEADPKIHRNPDSLTILNLEYTGRPVLSFESSQLVPEDTLSTRIYYDYNPGVLLSKPILAAAGIFAVFIIVIIFMRIDLSVGVPKSEIQAQEVGNTIFEAIKRFQKIVEDAIFAYDSFVDSNGKKNKSDAGNKPTFGPDEIKAGVDEVFKQLKEVPETETVQTRMRKVVEQVSEAYKLAPTSISAANKDAKKVAQFKALTQEILSSLQNLIAA